MDTSDNHALARMLSSEAKEENVKIAIGWITMQVAKRRKQSIYKLLTGGGDYGHQSRNGKSYYASTYQNPSKSDLILAQKLLSGEVLPSELIRRHVPGAWVERNQGISDQAICKLQDRWEEGIYGRLANSKWVLFSRDTKAFGSKPYDNASALLDSLPVL